MKVDKTQMKAYAGGLSGGIGVLAGTTLVEHLAKIAAWLISLTGAEAPPEVAGSIAAIAVIIGGFVAGRFITYWFPPNEVTRGSND